MAERGRPALPRRPARQTETEEVPRMNFNDQEVVSLVERLSNARGASGFEDEVLDVVRGFCEPWATVETNSLRCGFVTPNTFSGTKPVVMLDAHGDECGLMTKSVRDNGCLTFIQLGRFTRHCLVGQSVLVRTVDGGWVPGVVGAKPPHFMSAAELASGEDPEMTIDVGAVSRQDAVENFRVGIGEPVVPATRFGWDEKNRVMFGKAFDCRVGVAAMLLALRELAGMDLPFDVVAAVSSQEEVGERGVASSVRRFNPAVCYMFEGAPADDTFGEPADMQCRLKRGPMFRYADVCMITNPRYQRFVLAAAEEAGLPAQGAVRTGGGTDGGVAHLMANGIPCVVSGVPSRYIHAGCAIASLDDVENSARVAVAAVSRLTPEVVAGF
jgi:putative aminopeptidase FrvX